MFHSHQTGVENAVTRWRQKSKLVLVSLLLTGLLLAALLVAGYYLKTHRMNSKGVRLVSAGQVVLTVFARLCLVKDLSQTCPKCLCRTFRPSARDAIQLFYPLKCMFLHLCLHPWGVLDRKDRRKLHLTRILTTFKNWDKTKTQAIAQFNTSQ